MTHEKWNTNGSVIGLRLRQRFDVMLCSNERATKCGFNQTENGLK